MIGILHSLGKHVSIMDADLQDPPEALPKLMSKIEEGFDAVFAGRRGKYQVFHRMITSRIYKRLIHIICGSPVDSGIYVLMTRKLIRRLLKFEVKNPYIISMIGLTGLRTTSIPIERSVRDVGVTSYSSWMRIKLGSSAVFWSLKYRLRTLFLPNNIKDTMYIPENNIVSSYFGKPQNAENQNYRKSKV